MRDKVLGTEQNSAVKRVAQVNSLGLIELSRQGKKGMFPNVVAYIRSGRGLGVMANGEATRGVVLRLSGSLAPPSAFVDFDRKSMPGRRLFWIHI